ncbi:hypothetical protein [Syntrophobacter fumaroxidans]|uniref:Uncharacterized protein n=1 Tax=Syntrophobacter fumaroxidans (strain DSM 10017 / MPOB) TaxID=335543 RepID=A0LM92_SYNFM|nr:hypothetical protein [Syntrophobacter fumaroxidans]ABK18544.1 hypothetical protein Sfum_2867 [Syntrophobacter fumaroxidans MPOB]
MKANGTGTVVLGLAVFMLLGFLSAGGARAQSPDVKAMLTQANKELRQAEKDMFAGKSDQSIAALESIGQLIARLKAADADNPGVKAAENGYSKLVKDLERRTGKDLGGGTLTAAGSSTPTVLPDKPTPKAMPAEGTAPPAAASSSEKPASVADSGKAVEPAAGEKSKDTAASSAKVPYEARKPLADATQRLASLEKNLGDLADPGYSGDKDQLVKRVEEKLAEIRGLLDEARKLAAQKGVASHPEFDRLEAELTSAGGKAAQARGGYEKQKAEASARAGEVDADVAALKSELDGVSPVFQAANGAAIYYNDLKPVEELITRIESFERNELPGIRQKLEAFARKYGSTAEAIDTKAQSGGYSGQQRASYPYTELAKGIENVGKTRTAMAESLVDKARAQLDGMAKAHDFSMAEQLAGVKAWIATAARYQSDNPAVVQARAVIDQQIAQAMQDFNARIDKRTWPGQAANAPADADGLRKAALEWFKNSADWGRREKDPRRPLAVVVTGPWSIQERNIVGEPTMYGLPVLLAVEVDSDKDLKVARVFALTMRTAERVGVKMEPPFDHVTVGDSYFIRSSAIK